LTIPWALLFVAKTIAAIAAIDVTLLPILWHLRAPLPQCYVPITCFEGGLIAAVGVLLLVNSLASKVALTDDRYVRLGVIRRGIRFKELKNHEKRSMRRRGILMVMIGLLLFVPTLIVLLPE